MEENEPNLNIEEALLKKIDSKSKKTQDSTSTENNADEKDKSPIADQEQQATAEDEAANRSGSPSRNSPDPNCAICLEKLQNKSFTDSCFHMFCFTCLVEWSKVKAECPLCKQQFKSIVHNVRSARDYDQYHIQPKRSNSVWSFLYDQRFRYRTTLTSGRLNERNNNELPSRSRSTTLEHAFHQEIASHRLRYAPHSVQMYSNSHATSRVPNSFRQRIYEQDMWVVPSYHELTRLATPQFYQENPACTHRLIPWLNRELVALLQNGDSHVTFVMELIMALINRYEINGREFFLHVEPYLAHHTSHFIHEFYNFAISPHDMEAYDNNVVYEGAAVPDFTSRDLSTDNDVIFLSLNSGQKTGPLFHPALDGCSRTQPLVHPTLGSCSSRKANLRSYRIKKNAYKSLKKLVLKRNNKSNLWESALHTVSSSFPSSLRVGSNTHFRPPGYQSPGPSTYRPQCSFSTLLEVAAAVADAASIGGHSGKTNEKDDECMIVDEVKPRHERTPEIVLLSSEDEQQNREEDVLSDSELSPSVPRTSKEHISVTLESDSSDIECVYEGKYPKINFETQNKKPSPSHDRASPIPSTSQVHVSSPSPSRSASPVLPVTPPTIRNHKIKYNYLAPLPRSSCKPDSPIPSTSRDHDSSHIDPSPSRSTSPDLPVTPPSLPTIQDHKSKYNYLAPRLSCKPLYTENENNSFQLASSSSLEKRRDTLSSSQYASTESYSDSEHPPDRSSEHKKFKLRSVIAHFSVDRESDSSRQRDAGHHSSHKRHKEKKKKKRKHSHKHRHRIYSESD